MKIATIVLLTFGISVTSSVVHASQWTVCRYEIDVIGIDQAKRHLSAKLLAAKGALSPECPTLGDVLSFTPETSDYQSELPRRKWPQPGKRGSLTYRHLDGICKADGASKPCRIKHYSIP